MNRLHSANNYKNERLIMTAEHINEDDLERNEFSNFAEFVNSNSKRLKQSAISEAAKLPKK